MTDRSRLDRWLADTEWAEVGGDGGDAMRCRPRADATADAGDASGAAPWITSPRRDRLRTFDAVAFERGGAPTTTIARAAGPQHEPSCPVHGPTLAGICWQCTEHLGSRFTGIATVDPETGLIAFL